MSADRASIISFLDALSRQSIDMLHAIEAAALAAFPDVFIRMPSGVAVRGGCTTAVMRVMELLGISDGEAEVIFNNLPDDPAVLAEYLRPRLLGGGGRLLNRPVVLAGAGLSADRQAACQPGGLDGAGLYSRVRSTRSPTTRPPLFRQTCLHTR